MWSGDIGRSRSGFRIPTLLVFEEGFLGLPGPLFCPTPCGVTSFNCFAAVSTDCLVSGTSELSLTQCLQVEFDGSELDPDRSGLLGILASKLKTFWANSGHSNPHLQVPSVVRYSIT